jgi:hypothetical protein
LEDEIQGEFFAIQKYLVKQLPFAKDKEEGVAILTGL